MKEPGRCACLVRRLARLASLIVIVTLAGMMLFVPDRIAHLAAEGWVLMVCFPFAYAVGLVLAWRREMTGGLISIAAMAAFYVVHIATGGGLPGGYVLAFVVPGVGFLVSHEMWRRVHAAGAAHTGGIP